MTRIDSHALPPPARPAQKPSAGHDNRQDFLEHLHADQPAAREPGARADKRMPTLDGQRPLRHDTKPEALGIRPQAAARPDMDASMGAGAAGAAKMPGPDDDLLPQAARHAPIAIAEATVRARVFEQHWFANGYLSFIADAGEGEGSGKGARAAGTPVERMSSAATSEPAIPPAAVPAGDERSDAMASWPVALEGAGSGIDAPARSIERMARALGPLVMADQPWPERLMRLSRKPDGKAALWVRDYALSPSAVDPLVAHLRQLARKEGVALERVMVNGTVVWHSEPFKGDA